MLGYSAYRVSSLIQIVVGGVCAVAGLGMFTAPLFGADPAMMAGAIGPLIAGAVNIGVGLSFRRKMIDHTCTVQLTPEAKALLMGRHRRLYGWMSPGLPWTPGLGLSHRHGLIGGPIATRRARRMAMWTGVTPDMVPDDIEEDELVQLDRVAAEYNRTIGALESSKAGSATLAKMAPRILKAADEAMADALHQAAMLVKYPEGGSAAKARLKAQENSLREIAERVESLATDNQGFTDKVAYKSSIDDVLDELRLESLARAELKQTEEQRQVQKAQS
jgi:hypothetical protein